MTVQEFRECEDILAMFSPTNPMIVHQGFYQIIKAAGLPMENVIMSKPLPTYNTDG